MRLSAPGLCRRVAVLTLAMTQLVPGRALAADADSLLLSANQDHVWFVNEAGSKSKEFSLCHVGPDMGGPFYRPQASLSQFPVRIASWGNRVWVAFESNPRSAESRRDVFTIEVQRNVALGGYHAIPSDHLDITDSLPGGGTLVGFCGTADGPVALLVPRTLIPAATSGPLAAPTFSNSFDKPLLMQLQREKWVAIELPPDFDGGGPCLLAATGVDGRQLSIVSRLTGSGNRSVRHDRDAAGRWTVTELPLDVRNVRSMTTVSGQLAAVTTGPSDDTIEVICLRPSTQLRLAGFPEPAGHWAAAGTGDDVLILQRQDDGQLLMQTLGARDGVVSPPQRLTVQPFSSARLWQISLLAGVTLFGVFMVFLVRPAGETAMTLPAGVAALPPMPRVVALLIDLVPAGFLAMLLTRCQLTDLLTVPFLTGDIEQSVPYLVMAGLTVLHSGIGEIFWGRSLGKLVVNASVIRSDGAPAGAGQLLLRNALKGIVLLVPPLAVVAFLNPHLQGLADLGSRTLVVTRHAESLKD